ncbi:hypothetical protein C7H84_02875 [Burkholderia sp. Nafp2/4-1b]|nr:hypothetical protein C7H84_02875 [Burkholderia sp. Nafp2/4-1b]
MPGASVFGTADGSPLIRPNQLTQTPCHVGANRAQSPAVQGSRAVGRVTAVCRARRISMHGGTDVVRCSTVGVRHRGAFRRNAMHVDAASRALSPRGCPRVRGRCEPARAGCRHARRRARRPVRARWPGYC